MAVIAMDSTLEDELSEATCTMLQSGLVRDRPFTHIFMVASVLDLCLDGNTVQA